MVVARTVIIAKSGNKILEKHLKITIFGFKAKTQNQ